MMVSVNLPREIKREAERRKAHLVTGRGLFPGLPENRGTRQRLSASRRGDFFDPGTVLPAQARASSPSRQAFARPSPVPPSHLRQTLDSGVGRLPKAPRVHACEAWPRAPHPTGSGYPLPAKLSLCPTSERLMKRPSLDRTREL